MAAQIAQPHVQHQSSTHMMKTTKSGRPFVKDIHDLFSTLIVSLPMDSHRHMFRTYPNTFTTEEAVLNLSSLKFTQSNHMAKSVCQTFMDAKLFEHAIDTSNRAFRDKNLYALTSKGIYVLEKFVNRNGIIANNLSKMFASHMSPIRLYFLERNPDNDSILLNKSAIEAVTSDSASSNSSTHEKGDRNLGIELKDRQQNHKTYRHTFHGLPALDWLCDFTTAIAREEASKIANEFLRLGLIEPVPDKKSEKSHEIRFSRSTLYQVTDEGRYVAGWDFDLSNNRNNNGTEKNEKNGLRGMLSIANLNKSTAADHAKHKNEPFDPSTTPYVQGHKSRRSSISGKDLFPGIIKQESSTKRLQQILEDPTLCSLFMNFVKANFCEENLLFLLDVKEFKSKYGHQLNEAEQKLLISDALQIYNKYLAPVCPHELNIDHALRQQMIQYMTNNNETQPTTITLDIYDKIEDTIFRLMASDSIPKFIRTEKYLNAVYEKSSIDGGSNTSSVSSSPPTSSSNVTVNGRSITPEPHKQNHQHLKEPSIESLDGST
ncbi:1367_t:CDS:2, partial [Ambispora leptoticha]